MWLYRFAAKEATKKASVSRQLSWHDICVRVSHSSRPFIVIRPTVKSLPAPVLSQIQEGSSESKAHGKASQGFVETEEETEEQVAQLSLSHDGEYAIAMVMVADEALE